MKTIIWDVDDVLNDLMRVWLENWCFEHPACTFPYNEITRNPPAALLSTTLDEYHDSLDRLRQSPLYREMAPVREVWQWFSLHGRRFHHGVLSAVPLKSAPISAQWVFSHFGEWIRSFHFVPTRRQGEANSEYDRNKAEFLVRQKNVDLFIDDNMDHINAAQNAGINTLLFPRPWNDSTMSVDELLSRVAEL